MKIADTDKVQAWCLQCEIGAGLKPAPTELVVRTVGSAGHSTSRCRFFSRAHALERSLKKTFHFVFQFCRWPSCFVDAEPFIVRTNGKLAPIRNVGAMNLEMIAVGIVKINFRSLGS